LYFTTNKILLNEKQKIEERLKEKSIKEKEENLRYLFVMFLIFTLFRSVAIINSNYRKSVKILLGAEREEG